MALTSDDIKRLYFYERQFLGARDFRDEQSYHVEMRRRHLIAHHLWGIVAGLDITQDVKSKAWYVQPGMAVDGFGREILVFEPVALDLESITEAVARDLGGTSPANLRVWIAYKTEKAQPPPALYQSCDQADQFTRIRETFQLIYQNDPRIDLNPTSSPGGADPADPQTWPRPFQDLPDDPEQYQWPVYLGTLLWNAKKDPNQPIQKVDNQEDKQTLNHQTRRYLGVAAAFLEAPQDRLVIEAQADRQQSGPKTLMVNLEGSLKVAEKAGIGLGEDSQPATRLHIVDGDPAALNTNGYLMLGPTAGVNLVLDDHALMARKGIVASELQLQGSGGDLQVGSEFIIKGDGKVGIGTKTPGASLEIGKSGDLILKAEKDYAGDIIFQDSTGAQKGRIWSKATTGSGLYLSTKDANPTVTLDDQGRVGIGTQAPEKLLHVAGDIKGINIQGDTVAGASWSRTEPIDITQSITTLSTQLVEIPFYTQKLNSTPINIPALACLTITLHIPFTGNDTAESRSRILLKFDDIWVCDSTKFNNASWELHEITLTGVVKGVTEGAHTVRVFAAVDKGTLHIPHYNSSLIEAQIPPGLFANLFLLGFY